MLILRCGILTWYFSSATVASDASEEVISSMSLLDEEKDRDWNVATVEICVLETPRTVCSLPVMRQYALSRELAIPKSFQRLLPIKDPTDMAGSTRFCVVALRKTAL